MQLNVLAMGRQPNRPASTDLTGRRCGSSIAAIYPAWFVPLWLALGAGWVVIRIHLDRKHAVRTPSRSAAAPGWQPSPFSLSDYERNLFGVRQLGDLVVFGPSGRQIASGTLLQFISVSVRGGIASLNPRLWVTLLTMACGVAAFVIGLACFRVRVWVSPSANPGDNHSIRRPEIARAITSCWISLVPSKIVWLRSSSFLGIARQRSVRQTGVLHRGRVAPSAQFWG
jgi:hypothetical protein